MESRFTRVAVLTLARYFGLLGACVVLLGGCLFSQSTHEPTLEPLAKAGPSSTVAPSTAESVAPTGTPSPTPTATPSPTPAATPLPASTATPSLKDSRPTDLFSGEDLAVTSTPAPPLSLSDMRVVELSRDVRPTDLLDDKYVGIGSDGEVYLVSITTGEMRQLTNDGHRKFGAVISANYVAWTDQRRKVGLPGADTPAPSEFSDDIFLLDLNTGEERRITEEPAKRHGLQIAGSPLVWHDSRNELGEHYTHFDIYAYDLAEGRETPVAVEPGAQRWPAIHGDKVVWTDNRNSPLMGTVKAGCNNCPGQPIRHLLLRFQHWGREATI